jgi:hypothetical protein
MSWLLRGREVGFRHGDRLLRQDKWDFRHSRRIGDKVYPADPE